jgi:D-alanyl-D-alanine carboxypeptidase/D-alanyl-D-alanine-endopeptidase (penicillin-binding protein 4)
VLANSFNAGAVITMNKANLISGLKALLHHKELQGASCALVVKDAKGNTLLSYNPGLFLVPASTMKLIATSTALHMLGPAYRFRTPVSYTGTVNSGSVMGDLVIEGRGDPTVGSHYFDETSPLGCYNKVMQMLKAQGIVQVEGNIVIDSSWFNDPLAYQDWTVEDYPWYYGAIPQAFNFIDNSIPIRQNGSNVTVTNITGVSERILRKEFEVFPLPGIDEIKATGCPASEKKSVYVNPSLAPSHYKDEKLSLADPAGVFAEGLTNYLAANGIKILGGKKDGAGERHELGALSSPALYDIVKNTHFDSINLFAECIYLTEQKAFVEKSGTANDYWKAIIGDNAFSAADGSGLSRKNCVTAAFLADLLLYMMHDAKSGDFAKTLPLLGHEGTVKHYCMGLNSRNQVRLKTGSMGHVRSFAGIVEGNEPLTFAMIFNNYQCSEGEIRSLCDRMLKEFAMA